MAFPMSHWCNIFLDRNWCLHNGIGLGLGIGIGKMDWMDIDMGGRRYDMKYRHCEDMGEVTNMRRTEA